MLVLFPPGQVTELRFPRYVNSVHHKNTREHKKEPHNSNYVCIYPLEEEEEEEGTSPGKLQAVVYDILPSTTSITDCTRGLEKEVS